MRALICTDFGPPEDLTLGEATPLTAGPGQVVIDIEAAGVNFVDGLMVQGGYQIKPPLPFIPGSEIAGVVASIGEGVEALSAGMRVVSFCGLGGFAEQVVVPEAAAVPLPEKLDAPRGATFVQSYSTALYALRDRAVLKSGEKVLVLGGGGGVGLAAIQLAKALGAQVLAGASTEGKRELALAAGADEVVDTAGADIKAAARAWSGGGVDVTVDPVGGRLADAGLRALGERGRFLVIGFASGVIPSQPLNQVLLRNRSLVGVDWGAWAIGNGFRQRALLEELFGMVAEGRLWPIEPTIQPLADGGRAMADLLGRKVTGKIALVP